MTDIVGEIIVAVIAFCGTLIAGITTNQKTLWRLQELERKVEKHNQLVERVTRLEVDGNSMWKRIDELKEEMTNEH